MKRAPVKKDAQFVKRKIALRTNLKKRKKFKEKIKKKFEIISVFSPEDIQKIKKILIKNVT